MAARKGTRRRSIASVATTAPVAVPPPISGLNTRDALTAMDPTDAVVLDNWYPDGGGVQVRGGSASFATGMGANPVQTLAEYYSKTTRKFLAACSGKVFDISAGGAVGAPLGTGFTSDQWQYVNFNGSMFLVNGTDAPQQFDGTTLSAAGFTGPTSVNDLIGVAVYKNRLFFWEKNSQDFWYAGINAVTGVLTKFPLSMVGNFGGNLMTVTSFSHDGGDGVQDYIVFVMSSGEVIIYLGTDPEVAADWALAGRYRIGAPVSIRAVCRYGADAYLTTSDDHVPLSQVMTALKFGTVPPRSKISGAVTTATAAGGNLFGWEGILYPRGKRLIFNVPNADGTFYQHVYNFSTNAWCRFTGMNAQAWGLYEENLYFGGANGVVYRADIGNTDSGAVIQATGQQAWNQFGSVNRKRVAVVRPIVQSVGSVPYAFAVGVDYGSISAPVASSTPSLGSPWDTSPWDTSPWSAETAVDLTWRVVGVTGQAVGWQLSVSAQQQISWLRTDLRLETGVNL